MRQKRVQTRESRVGIVEEGGRVWVAWKGRVRMHEARTKSKTMPLSRRAPGTKFAKEQDKDSGEMPLKIGDLSVSSGRWVPK